MTHIDLKPIRTALAEFGPHMQIDILIEEMSELVQAIIKARRQGAVDYRTKEVVEELADVMICLESLKMVLDGRGGLDDLLQGFLNEKLNRLKTRCRDWDDIKREVPC